MKVENQLFNLTNILTEVMNKHFRKGTSVIKLNIIHRVPYDPRMYYLTFSYESKHLVQYELKS